MITMHGQYNSANIMIDEIDETTRAQIQEFLNHPAFGGSYIAIMPDCHAGIGAVIGFTMELGDYVIPNVIGVDIGCGMLSAKLIIEDPEDFNVWDLDDAIKKRVPSGFHIHEKPPVPQHKSGYDEVKDTCSRIGIDWAKAIRGLGTLGGGNHFIELGMDGADYWLTIHSGSRNFGLKVANFYQTQAKAGLAKYLVEGYKNLEYLPMDTPEAMDYMHDLGVAQRFASTSREMMLQAIIDELNIDVDHSIESVHNFIGKDNIIRKGATSADKGEPVIIPFNMRDGLIIGTGKGSAKYNYSAPHGAGRILSRKKAKEQISMEEFQNSMTGVASSTICEKTLDEAPQAYKGKEIILDNIQETVEVKHFIKPIYNFKSTS